MISISKLLCDLDAEGGGLRYDAAEGSENPRSPTRNRAGPSSSGTRPAGVTSIARTATPGPRPSLRPASSPPPRGGHSSSSWPTTARGRPLLRRRAARSRGPGRTRLVRGRSRPPAGSLLERNPAHPREGRGAAGRWPPVRRHLRRRPPRAKRSLPRRGRRVRRGRPRHRKLPRGRPQDRPPIHDY